MLLEHFVDSLIVVTSVKVDNRERAIIEGICSRNCACVMAVNASIVALDPNQ